MKLTIDFNEKTLLIEDSVQIGELISELNKLFSKEVWEKFTLVVKVKEVQSYPYYKPWWETQPISDGSGTIPPYGIYYTIS